MENLLSRAATPELVDEAIVWAYQHGLVRGAARQLLMAQRSAGGSQQQYGAPSRHGL